MFFHKTLPSGKYLKVQETDSTSVVEPQPEQFHAVSVLTWKREKFQFSGRFDA
jgi:hypothetical protein